MRACLPQAGCAPFTSMFSPSQSFFLCCRLNQALYAAVHSGSTCQTPHLPEPGGNFSGLLFIGVTNYDKKFRPYDISNGNATPASYSVNGRQFIVIAAAGGKDLKSKSGGVYVAFALPETVHP